MEHTVHIICINNKITHFRQKKGQHYDSTSEPQLFVKVRDLLALMQRSANHVSLKEKTCHSQYHNEQHLSPPLGLIAKVPVMHIAKDEAVKGMRSLTKTCHSVTYQEHTHPPQPTH